MRVFLILLGATISVGALLFWLWLNGMAAAWSTSNTKPPVAWFTKESVYFFWLPFAVGVGLALWGWRRT